MSDANNENEGADVQEYSILKKSIIPNLLEDDFNDEFEECSEPTFLTEVSEDEVEVDLKEEKEVLNTSTVLDQEQKRNNFKNDFDFRKTLINEESLENIKEPQQNDEAETTFLSEQAENFKPNFSALDIFAAVGVVAVVMEFLFFML